MQDRGKDELAERPSGVNDSRGRASRFQRQSVCRRTEENGKTTGAGADGGKQPEGNDQPPGAAHERRQCAARSQQEQAAKQHASRPETVGQCSGKRLSGPPDELADGHGQADRRDP